MFNSKISATDITATLQSLLELLRLNYSVDEAIEHLIQFPTSEQLLPLLSDIRRRLHRGEDIASAFSAHREQFGHGAIALLSSASFTGDIDLVLADIIQHRNWMHSLNRKLIQELFHPLLTAASMLAAAGFQLVYVVPRATEFVQAQGDVGMATKWLIILSEEFNRWALPFFSLVFLLIISLLLSKRYRSDIYQVTKRVLQRLVFMDRAFQNLDVARYLRSLSVLLNNEIGLQRSMRLAEESVNDFELRKRFACTRKNVEAGHLLSAAMKAHLPILASTLSILAVAEKSAAMNSRMRLLSDLLQREAQATIQRACLLLVPMCLCVSGLMLLWIVVGVFVPMYESTLLMEFDR